MNFFRLLFTPRGLFAATGVAALGLVAGGMFLQQTLNLAACPLCILQRMLYLLLALESLAAWMLAGASHSKTLPRRAAAQCHGPLLADTARCPDNPCHANPADERRRHPRARHRGARI